MDILDVTEISKICVRQKKSNVTFKSLLLCYHSMAFTFKIDYLLFELRFWEYACQHLHDGHCEGLDQSHMRPLDPAGLQRTGH